MKKIGIITLNGYKNFGNRLQNYALQEIIKGYNFEVVTVLAEENRESNQNANVLNKFKKLVKDPNIIIKKIYNVFYLRKLNNGRTVRFRRFTRKYIKESTFKLTEENMSQKNFNDFSYFVTGSDQVWNPYYTKSSPLFFLAFVPKEKRIAYSPSFGVSELPKEFVEDYKSMLNDMAFLSVREGDGKRIIKRLTNRDAEVVADPTMLLSRKKWLSISKPADNKPKQNILLTYFLGETTRETKVLISKYEREHNLKVVNLSNPRYKEYYLTDPSEFLDYINSAKVFLTDSFHGAVFSILFETPFIVTDRKGKLPSMNSRIRTLLSTFKLENRHIDNIKDEEILKLDFSHTESIIESERNRSFNYLKLALSKKE